MLINSAIGFYKFNKIVFKGVYFNFITSVLIKLIAISY